jgi:hypothetical protein
MTMSGLKAIFSTRPWIAATFAAALGVAGCGGSADDVVGTGGTGAQAQSIAVGRISGFGSIIVNGVRFDDSTARINDDDGVAHVRGDLKLGMVVDVKGGALTNDATAGTSSGTASSIVFGSEIKGAVQSVDIAAGTLSVVGQTVKVDAATIFDGFANGLASVQAGNLVEIFAFFDSATHSYQATRVELKNALVEFKLRGVVAGLDTTAKTFDIGGATIGLSSVPASELPALSNGLLVRVTLQPAQQSGVWVATKIRSAVRNIEDRTEAEVEGVVSDFSSLSSFKVNGVAVDASGTAVVFKDGTSGQVINGVRVEVEGQMQNGVLVASRVELKQAGQDGHDAEVELHGNVESVDAVAKSFVLRGVTVTYDGSTRFDDGTAVNLIVNAQIEVRGTLTNSGNNVAATRIKFEH